MPLPGVAFTLTYRGRGLSYDEVARRRAAWGRPAGERDRDDRLERQGRRLRTFLAVEFMDPCSCTGRAHALDCSRGYEGLRAS